MSDMSPAALEHLLKIIVASASGAWISRKFSVQVSGRVFLGNMVASIILSVIFSDSIAKRLGDITYAGPISITIGMFGLAICSTLAKILRDVDWAKLVTKRIGGE